MKNVLFIAHTSSLRGGASFSLLSLVQGLRSQVNVLVLLPSKGELQEKLKQLSIDYRIIKYMPSSALYYKSNKFFYTIKALFYSIINLLALRQLKKCIKNKEIDIIHSNSSVIDIGYHIALSLGIKHVWHLREFQNLDYNLRPFCGFRNFKKKLNNSYCIPITNSIAKHYELKQNYSVIYNGIIVKSNNILNNKKKQFVFCGSLSYNKGIEDAILAFSKFSEVRKDYKLVICGSATSKKYFNYLEEMVDSLNITENVIFKGFIENKEEIISSSLALLMCSKFEALGRVSIESLMLKTLVIGKNTGGTEEIIKKDLLYGFLYSDIEDLAYKMRLACNRPDLVEEITKRSYDYSLATFSLGTHLRNIHNVYQKL